jgi:NTE family protein
MLRHLVIAGGGPRCVSFMGALDVLHRLPQFDGISDYWGNSAGAILATLLSLKIPYTKLYSVFNTIDFAKFRDVDLNNIVSFSTHWGLDSGDAFIKNIRVLLENVRPGSSEYTLQELPGLHITCTDLTDTKPVVLDSRSFPTLKVVDALRASTSIPFFYCPFRNPINGHMLVDGGVSANFPWIYLPDDRARASALGLDFNMVEIKEPTTLGEYIPKILQFREHYWSLKHLKPSGPNIIKFKITGFPAWHLRLNQQDRDELFRIGKATTETWLAEGGTKWLATLRSERESSGDPPKSDRRYTQTLGYQPGQTDESSGTLQSSAHLPAQDSFRHLSSQSQLSSRRWSV